MPWSFANQISVAEVGVHAGLDDLPRTDDLNLCLKALIDEKRFPDAVKFLANALEGPAAIEWGLRCIEGLRIADLDDERKAAADSVKAWLASPTDDTRRAAFHAAEDAGIETVEGCLAMSVFFSGGSVAPSSAPEVPPSPNACQKIVAGAVLLAVVSEQPENSEARFGQALKEPG